MAIQMRRGAESDLDKSKMLPGELAVTTDGSDKLYCCFGTGNVKEFVSGEQIGRLEKDYVVDYAYHVQTGRDGMLQAGASTCNWRKWNSGLLEIWGFARLDGNLIFNQSSWFGGYTGVTKDMTNASFNGQTSIPVWGTWAVPFIEPPHVEFTYVSSDSGYTGDMVTINVGGSMSDYLRTTSPRFKYLRGSSGTTFGHPAHTFRAVGRWK